MNASEIDEIFRQLSSARMQTYLNITQDKLSALQLYELNSTLSSAFIQPLESCEVVLRNAIAEAITNVHGGNWLTNTGFRRSLPHYKRIELEKALENIPLQYINQSRIIPTLSFSFWQSILTRRFDRDIWNREFINIFPNYDREKNIQQNRENLYLQIGEIRAFRNRIAHHEPIFNKNPTLIYQNIYSVVAFRSEILANWINSKQQITELMVNFN